MNPARWAGLKNVAPLVQRGRLAIAAGLQAGQASRVTMQVLVSFATVRPWASTISHSV